MGSKKLHPRIASRIFNTPLLIEPRKLEAIIAGLGERVGLPEVVIFEGPKIDAAYDSTSPRQDRPYVVNAGIAEISIIGPLVQRAGQIAPDSSPLASYEDIGAQIDAALADPEVQGILLRIDSPGGEVAGNFDLVDKIRAARDVKPIVALAEDLALSGGYSIASAANEIFTTQTGFVGSIGVITTHVDMSGLLANEGIVVTYVFAGDRKADGSPYFPLSPEAKAQLASWIARDYEIFVDAVAAGRPNLAPEAVRATQAGIFTAQDGIAAGLADAVGTVEDARARLQELIGAKAPNVAGTPVDPAIHFMKPPFSKPTVGVEATDPAPGGNEEVRMDPTKKSPEVGADGGGAMLAALQEQLKAAEARAAKAEAKVAVADATIAEIKSAAKTRAIKQAQVEGRVVGANLAAVEKLAAVMEAEELEKYLAELPEQTHARATGVADAAKRPDESLRKIAGRIGMSPEQIEAYSSVTAVHLDGTVTLANGDRVQASSITGGGA